MPSYTLGEIMSQGTTRAGMRSELAQSTVSFLANEAYLEVYSLAIPTSSETTTFLSLKSGSASTSLPSSFFEPILFSLQSGGSHQTLAETARETIDSAGTAAGVPTEYILFGSTIEVRPVPNSDWTLHARFRTQFSDLTDTSATPSLSTPWRPAIVLKLEEKIHALTGNVSLAALAQQRFLSYVASMPTDEARRAAGDTPRGVRVLY